MLDILEVASLCSLFGRLVHRCEKELLETRKEVCASLWPYATTGCLHACDLGMAAVEFMFATMYRTAREAVAARKCLSQHV